MNKVSAQDKRRFFFVALWQTFTAVLLGVLMLTVMVTIYNDRDADYSQVAVNFCWLSCALMLATVAYFLGRRTMPRYDRYIKAAERTGLNYGQMKRCLIRLPFTAQEELINNGSHQDFMAARTNTEPAL